MCWARISHNDYCLFGVSGADDVNAKHTAYFHIFFNVSGVAAVTALLLPVYLPFIENVVMGGVDPNMQATGGGFPYMTAGIAVVHTTFNVLTALLFVPFVTPIASALNRFVKDKSKPVRAQLTHLDFQLVSSTLTAIDKSKPVRAQLTHLDFQLVSSTLTAIGNRVMRFSERINM